MSVQDNVQVVKNGYEAFARRDIPALLALLSDDVEWIHPGSGLPLSGTYRGHGEVANFFRKLAQEVDIQDFQPREFVAEGDRVLVTGSQRGKVKSTNRGFDLEWVMAFTVRDGKVAKFREYTDTQAIAAAFGTAARAAG